MAESDNVGEMSEQSRLWLQINIIWLVSFGSCCFAFQYEKRGGGTTAGGRDATPLAPFKVCLRIFYMLLLNTTDCINTMYYFVNALFHVHFMSLLLRQSFWGLFVCF